MNKLVKKNILSLITALLILYLSFARADTFDKVNVFSFRHLDKVVHICMYFGLMIVLLYENRSVIKNIRIVFLMAIIPFSYGSLIEFLQSWLTTTRKGDILDAIFNLTGIVLAIIAWRLFRIIGKKEI